MSEPKEFVVNHDEDSNCSIVLDVDITYRPCPNHLQLYSRYDTSVGDCEYEYRIEGISVFVRLIQERDRNPGEPEHSDVLDGVVQEAAIREREGKKKKTGLRFLDGSVEEKIESLKKATEWTRLATNAWNGFPYFLLSWKLPRSDARRYFRQELQRLTNGEKLVVEAAAKLGYEPKEAGGHFAKGYRKLHLINGRKEPSEEESKAADLPGVIARAGLTYEEFCAAPRIISQLNELLAEEAQVGDKNIEKSKDKSKNALVMKGVSWLTLSVLMAGYYALALMLMWNWFVAESLHVPELSFVAALGIMWTISLVRKDSGDAVFSNKRWDLLFSVLEYCVPESKTEALRELVKEKTEGVWSELMGLVFAQAAAITFTLILGWTAHTFGT